MPEPEETDTSVVFRIKADVGSHRLQAILDKLQALEFIETTGKTSGLSYILHISKRKDTSDKIEYVKSKKQEKARQKEAILRYLDSIETITNPQSFAFVCRK